MAEIHLERRERTIWPWILGALVVLALLIWFFMDRGPRMADVDVDAPPAVAPGPPVERAPGAAGDFQDWVRETAAVDEAARDHQYTATGIRQLADAIADVTQRDIVSGRPLDEQLDRLRQYADRLQEEELPLTHAGHTRSAFLLATELLVDIDNTDYPHVDTGAEQTRVAAGAVDVNVPLLEQIGTVERFFENASNTVAHMAHAHEGQDVSPADPYGR